MSRPSSSALLRLTALVAACLAACACLAARADALTIQHSSVKLDGEVVVSPSAVRVPAKPGQTVIQHLIVQNRNTAPITFQIQLSEVVGGNAQDVVNIRHGVREGAAAWATVEQPTLTLKPGDTGTMKVTITVPKHVPPGSQAFAVSVIEQAQQQTQTSGAGIAPIFSQEAIFVVDLPGNAPIKGTIVSGLVSATTGHGAKQRTVSFTTQHNAHHWIVGGRAFQASLDYHNGGSRLLTPQGTVTITNMFGHEVKRYAFTRFTVYPDGDAAPTIPLKGFPGVGPVKVQISLTSAAGQQHITIGRIWVAPRWLIIVAKAVAMLLLAWILLIAYRMLLADAGPLALTGVALVPWRLMQIAVSVIALAALVLSWIGVWSFDSPWVNFFVGTAVLLIALIWGLAWLGRRGRGMFAYAFDSFDEDEDDPLFV